MERMLYNTPSFEGEDKDDSSERNLDDFEMLRQRIVSSIGSHLE